MFLFVLCTVDCCSCVFTIGYTDSIVSTQEDFLWEGQVANFNCTFDTADPQTLVISKTDNPSNVITYAPASVAGDFTGDGAANSDSSGVYADVTLTSADIDYYKCSVTDGTTFVTTNEYVNITTFYPSKCHTYKYVCAYFDDLVKKHAVKLIIIKAHYGLVIVNSV